MMNPMNSGRRISGMALENKVMIMQYTANSAMRILITMAGTPCQIRVLDSRSYLRITASRSAVVSPTAAVSTCGAMGSTAFFFLNKRADAGVLPMKLKANASNNDPQRDLEIKFPFILSIIWVNY